MLDGQPGKISNGADDDPTADLAAFIYDALYQYDDQPQSIPNLAECEPDADELVWTCTLADATFHNGEPMTAEDVKYSYDLGISQNCTYSPSICLAGFVESAEIIDDRTVAFTLPQPYSPFTTLILPTLGIESKAVIEAAYEEFTGAAALSTRRTSVPRPRPSTSRQAPTRSTPPAARRPSRLPRTCSPRPVSSSRVARITPLTARSTRAAMASTCLPTCWAWRTRSRPRVIDAVAAVYSLLPFNARRSAPARTRWSTSRSGRAWSCGASGYHRAGTPATPTMNFVIITDLVAAASALAAGQVDYVEEMTPDAFEAVRNAETP